jgi:CBS domain-containing protein
MTIIGSLMKTDMVVAGPDDTVAEAVRSMTENEVGAVLVVQDRALVGILSERDVVSRIVREGRDPAATKVSEVATHDVVSVEVDVRIRECAGLLRDRRIRHLPVTENGKPAGILSSRDFFAFVVDGLENLVDRARYDQALEAGEDPYEHLGGSYGR